MTETWLSKTDVAESRKALRFTLVLIKTPEVETFSVEHDRNASAEPIRSVTVLQVSHNR
ncbi:hypothetical protein [Cryobacterium sp. PH31-L1]|uniref:hypothetical protein n=1 Tax=Cryobacterium sp. PH31-L1 TaxID=3046199 RepID=UPI0024BB80E6|nr:hypothetical protein [Cryobacterium sp. PH31-L1]MDJ0375875.1 hypothetical protein [Cryobacterium sp. PH31-L1]